jgi:hypothetical protein
MEASSRVLVESPTSKEDWFLDEWKENERDGYVNYILITSDRLRKGKTATAERIYELVETYLHNREPTIEDTVLTPLEDLERMDKVSEWTPLVGDEWNRGAGHRRWWTQENQDYAEVLQTTAYRHVHRLFPMPHESLLDNAIVGICTAQIVVEKPGIATVFAYERDQLNRTYKNYTPFLGELRLKMPNAKLWHEYERKRDEFTTRRKKIIEERTRANMEAALREEASPRSDELLSLIIASPDAYKSSHGKISAMKIAAKHKVSWHRAETLATQAREKTENSTSNIIS